MARFFILLLMVILLGVGSNSAPSERHLLNLKQRQALIEQFAQLQRQTQQLLAAQQSLTEVAIAAGIFNSAPVTVKTTTLPPEIVVAENVVAENVVPESVVPEIAVPESVVAENVAENVEPEAVEPENIAPKNVEPEAVEPERVVPESVVPEIIVPETNATETIARTTVTLPQKVTTTQLTPKLSLVIESHTTEGAPIRKVITAKPKKVLPKQVQKPKIVAEPVPSPEAPPLPKAPKINWGKCPELEPSESEKRAKAKEITACVEKTPLSGNLTEESVEEHREQIRSCALQAEGWFTQTGEYDYGKAEKEIKGKLLQKEMEENLLLCHAECKQASEEKYPSGKGTMTAQIQLYQLCMDYWIAEVCGITVN